MRVLVVMDPIENVSLKKDTSMAMLWAAARRGHELGYALQQDLYIDQGKAFGLIAPLQVFENSSDYYALGEKKKESIADYDVVLMRKDPPFDMNFVYATYILEQAEREGAWIINKPQSLRDCNEKLFATQFPELQVPTLVTSQQSLIREFIKEHGDVIVKPLDGMGGMGIFRLYQDGVNIGSTIEILTNHGAQPIMAQRYIPEIVDGDKRILMVNGEAVPYCLARIPQNGEVRGNLAAGGLGEARPLTENDKAIAAKVGPFLREKGLIFVGLDVIGNYVTEINVTSPTCVREIDAQFGTSIADDLFDVLEGQKKNESRSDNVVEQLKDYIEQNLNEDLSRSVLAGKVFLSEDYVSKIFMKTTGMSLPNYIAERRIKRAKEYLRGSSFPISKIAMEVGYGNFSYFSKTFRELVGCTPNEYRSRQK